MGINVIIGSSAIRSAGIKLPVDINEIGGTILSMAVLLGIIVDNGSEGFSDKHE